MVFPASADDEHLTVSRSEAAQRIQKQIDRLQMSVAQHNSGFERTTLEAPSQQRLHRSQVLGSYARALEVFRDFTSELLFRLFTSPRLKEMFVSSDESAQKLVDPIALGRVIHELVERVDLDILSKLNVVASEWRFRLEPSRNAWNYFLTLHRRPHQRPLGLDRESARRLLVISRSWDPSRCPYLILKHVACSLFMAMMWR